MTVSTKWNLRMSLLLSRHRQKVLDHVNLKFRIGEKLAIVGENGSGKSTFIKLFVPSLRSDRRRDPVKWNQH